MTLNIIGIDIAKAQFDVFELHGQNHTTRPNSPQGIKGLVKDLTKRGECQIIFEATGRYHKDLERALAKAGIAYTLVNPWQARRFAEATGKRAKTDKVDAQMLALMGQALQLNPTVIRDETIETLGEFELYRLALVQMRTAAKNREQILSHKALRRLATRQLKQIDKHMEAVVQEMVREVKAHPELQKRFDILQTIPGIGPTTALSLIIAMPELGTLSEKKVGALARLAPMDRQSGTYNGKAHIRGGRSSVRKALFMPALVAIRYNPDLKTFYERLTHAGKPKKLAVTAVMRKLIIITNTLIRDQRNWKTN